MILKRSVNAILFVNFFSWFDRCHYRLGRLAENKTQPLSVPNMILNDVTARRFNVLYGLIINFPNLPYCYAGRTGLAYFIKKSQGRPTHFFLQNY